MNNKQYEAPQVEVIDAKVERQQKDFSNKNKRIACLLSNKKIFFALLMVALIVPTGCKNNEERIATINFGTRNGFYPLPTRAQILDTFADPNVISIDLHFTGGELKLVQRPLYYSEAADYFEVLQAISPERISYSGNIFAGNNASLPSDCSEYCRGMHLTDSIRFANLGFFVFSAQSKP